ncbi:peptidoglycan DD-metalloendopeptidase family protein [Methylopila sp. 73B]|uniref:peptidoglycan DD-metalloendopeptidase family protein n=1 Tax=Methylopila sp. 73B TaxID=1120792 RepID=UPI0003711C51|nr:peptidoglycan DD-metalloendopeptidase family protein [Methylopila sp. 73B]
MRNVVPCLRAKLLARAALIAFAASGVAACSSDSSRFGESPFSNPFASASSSEPTYRAPAEPRYTGTVRAAPTSRIERAPLGAPSPAQSAPMRGFGGQQSANQPRSGSYEPQSTGSIPSVSRTAIARPAPSVSAASSNWSAEGGSTVTLAQGESVHTLSQRYGVPASAIMQANGLSSANAVGPGSRVVIPVYSSGGSRMGAAAPVIEAPRVAAAPQAVEAPRMAAAQAPARGGVHTVAPGETLSSVARQYNVSRTALAEANNIPSETMVRSGQKLSVPGAGQQMAAVKPVAPVAPPAAVNGREPKMQFVQGAQPKGAAPVAAPVAPVAPPAVRTAQAAPALKPSVPGADPQARAFAGAPSKPSAAPEPSEQVKTASIKVDATPEAAPSGPSFRWPVRGRVISGYGSKASGATNDGINLAVPEGTDVKASDDGVVAYAGSELKGFGNLVLIRHSNGWVTAYAHNSALEVKRGETIRRGQIIAKSGSTGNVTSPQLHFEVRKGAQAVDPMQHLAGI